MTEKIDNLVNLDIFEILPIYCNYYEHINCQSNESDIKTNFEYSLRHQTNNFYVGNTKCISRLI